MEELKRSEANLDQAASAIEAFLRALGIDPQADPELANTGALVARAYDEELLAGYAMDPAQILGDTLQANDSELVVLRDLATTTMCPHHLLPATGVVHLGYVPGDRIVGLGALSRLVECFARRLVLQETLVQQVADALVTHLGAQGAGCVARLSPTCLTARSTGKHGAEAVSLATAGTLRTNAGLRAEFLGLTPDGS